jgi:type I restriction enzyme R subunit
MDNYRKRVEQYIRSHENHLTIHKLKTNTPITAGELSELERLLFEAGDLGGKERFEQEYGHKPLGVFIRSIVGLDQQAVEAAFAEFLQQHSWSAEQMRFISAIIKHLTKNGAIHSRMLMTESPFTSIHDMGIIGLFDTVEISQIVGILQEVEGNALVG